VGVVVDKKRVKDEDVWRGRRHHVGIDGFLNLFRIVRIHVVGIHIRLLIPKHWSRQFPPNGITHMFHAPISVVGQLVQPMVHLQLGRKEGLSELDEVGNASREKRLHTLCCGGRRIHLHGGANSVIGMGREERRKEGFPVVLSYSFVEEILRTCSVQKKDDKPSLWRSIIHCTHSKELGLLFRFNSARNETSL